MDFVFYRIVRFNRTNFVPGIRSRISFGSQERITNHEICPRTNKFIRYHEFVLRDSWERITNGTNFAPVPLKHEIRISYFVPAKKSRISLFVLRVSERMERNSFRKVGTNFVRLRIRERISFIRSIEFKNR